MINAGAIACAGLAAALDDDSLRVVLDAYSRYAGRELEIDDAVYRSESETGHRNRAIAHLLSSFNVLDVSPDAAVDLYFRQCSISVDCHDLAQIAGTLANGGINPVTRERAVGEGVVREVLSVMTTCGMYDAAGDWLISVGLPAKSGVSGGIFAVLPGRLGIGVYSPPLDANGNSVRGVAVCRALSQDLGLHLVRPGERAAPPVRAQHDLGSLPRNASARPRNATRFGLPLPLTAVFELHGELDFMAAEALSRRIVDAELQPELVVIDLSRLARAERGGVDFLHALADSLRQHGGRSSCPVSRRTWDSNCPSTWWHSTTSMRRSSGARTSFCFASVTRLRRRRSAWRSTSCSQIWKPTSWNCSRWSSAHSRLRQGR
jgi:Glutaminase